MKRHDGKAGHRRGRSVWTVLTPSATGPADNEGHSIRIPARAFTFTDKGRAKRFAGNVKGAKVSKSGRFWTFKRVLIAALVVTVLVVALT